jgi:WD40 repeat protein
MQDGSIFVWDTSRQTLIASLWGHTGTVNAIEALNNIIVATGSNDGTIRVWDAVNAGALLTTISTSTGVLLLKTLPGRQRLAAFVNSWYIQFWNMTSYTLESQVASVGWLIAMELLPNGDLLTIDSANFIRVWNTISYAMINSYGILTNYNTIVSSQVLIDGTLVTLVNQYSGGLVSFWKSTNGMMLGTSQTFSQALFCSVKLGDNQIAVGGGSGYFEVLQIAQPSDSIPIVTRSGPLSMNQSVAINMLAYNGKSIALEYGYTQGYLSLYGENLTKTDFVTNCNVINLIEFQSK